MTQYLHSDSRASNPRLAPEAAGSFLFAIERVVMQVLPGIGRGFVR
jgi:hypothetical protein